MRGVEVSGELELAERILRRSFFDADSVDQLGTMRPKRVTERRDVLAAIRFFETTRGWTDGWTIHCRQGISRSPAIALGLLFLLRGDERAAGLELRRIRPEAE